MDQLFFERYNKFMKSQFIRCHVQLDPEAGVGVAMKLTPMYMLVRLYLAGYDVKPQIVSAFLSGNAGDAWDRMAKFDWSIK